MTAKTKRRAAARIERDVVEGLGGRKTFLSGAGADKSDGIKALRFAMGEDGIRIVGKYALRIEVKAALTAKRFTLSHRDWADVVAAATKAGQNPLLVISLSSVRLAVVRTSLVREVIKFAPNPLPLKPIKSLGVSWPWWYRICERTAVFNGLAHDRLRLHGVPETWGDVCIVDADALAPAIEAAEAT